MSIDLYTGLLLNQAASLTTSPEDADFFEFYTGLFDQVELALATQGLRYQEPRDVAGLEARYSRITQELIPFREAAEQLGQLLGRDFRHINDCSNYSTIFVPLWLPEPFYLEDTAVCSGLALAAHCQTVAAALGILDLADPFWAPLPGLDGAALAQDLARVETLLTAGPILQLNEIQRELAAAGCEKIVAACRFSLETGSSIVVSG